MHFTDIANFSHEWDLNGLPWDAVTAVDVGSEHPDGLDEKLVDAITSRAFTPAIEAQPKAKAAAIAFLYLYMILAHGGERYVHLPLNAESCLIAGSDHHSTSPCVLLCPSAPA